MAAESAKMAGRFINPNVSRFGNSMSSSAISTAPAAMRTAQIQGTSRETAIVIEDSVNLAQDGAVKESGVSSTGWTAINASTSTVSPQFNDEGTVSPPRYPLRSLGDVAEEMIRKTPKKLKKQLKRERQEALVHRPAAKQPATHPGKKPIAGVRCPPSAASGGIPIASNAYLALSNYNPVPLTSPQHLLVVIDLNGCILHRPRRDRPKDYVARPFAREFLKYCTETFKIVMWSSAKPGNVQAMCDTIVTGGLKEKVVAIWARDKFNLSPADYRLKVQCYKRLITIWNDPIIARSHPDSHLGFKWDQTNTVLIDDSSEKAKSEPYNLIKIPEYRGQMSEIGYVLPQVHDYLNYLVMHANVSACIRANPFKAVERMPVPLSEF